MCGAHPCHDECPVHVKCGHLGSRHCIRPAAMQQADSHLLPVCHLRMSQAAQLSWHTTR